MRKSTFKALAVLFAVAFFAPAGIARADTATVDMHAVSAEGIGSLLGTVVIEDVTDGIQFKVDVKGLPAGARGFHIHEGNSCEPGPGADGKPAAAMAAKGHFDPRATGKHLGPEGEGHGGDLPSLNVAEDGVAKDELFVRGLKVSDIKDRALMIHAGGDTYADTPPLGGGGARIACGIIK